MTYDAILPAGGRIDAAFAKKAGTDVKALIRIQSDTILSSTVSALRTTGLISRIVVIGGPEIRQEATGVVDEVIDEGTSGPDNILRGLKHLLASANPPQKVLIVTTDLPYVSADVLQRFLAMCPNDVDICVPIVRKTDFEKLYPNTTSTYVALAEESWTLGGAYVVDVEAFQKSLPQIERVFKNRKSVLGMAKLLGPRFLWLFLLKRLTIPDVEKKIVEMLGCTGKAIVAAPAELAFDIDALDDFEYAMEHKV